MLTLTRKVGEGIRIGDTVEIVVKEIRKNYVRIGISAPKNVKIFRGEIYVEVCLNTPREATGTEDNPDERGDEDETAEGGPKK